MKAQLDLLPSSFVLGPFDKGTSQLWMACQGYFYAHFHANLYKSPKRFTELMRPGSETHVSSELFNYLVSAVNAYIDNSTEPKPPTPLCEPLKDRIRDHLS